MNTNPALPSIADSAMLVYVRVSVWTARKLDKKQSKKLTDDANATDDAARVNKHLLASADEKLRKVAAQGSKIREYVVAKTVPWDDAGNRLLPNMTALESVGEIENMVREFDKLVDEFVTEYPVLRAQAIHNLGDMASDTDYPQPDEIRDKFRVRVTYSPVPIKFGDVRNGMTPEQASAWQSHFEGRVKDQVNDALADAWARLRERLEQYSDRLTLRESKEGPKVGIFRDSMVENLRETLDLLESLNVFGDQRLIDTAAFVRASIANRDPAQLRGNVESQVVKTAVDDVLNRMSSFLGV